jgi:hypothetical protein
MTLHALQFKDVKSVESCNVFYDLNIDKRGILSIKVLSFCKIHRCKRINLSHSTDTPPLVL